MQNCNQAYSVCFTGKALSGPRCSLCASAEHAVRDCPFYIERTLEAVMTVCAPRAGGVGGGGGGGGAELEQHTDGSVLEV